MPLTRRERKLVHWASAIGFVLGSVLGWVIAVQALMDLIK